MPDLIDAVENLRFVNDSYVKARVIFLYIQYFAIENRSNKAKIKSLQKSPNTRYILIDMIVKKNICNTLQ